ncbi:MAG: helix-turn-helix domain-containing protein [Sutterella wadsworthensis]
MHKVRASGLTDRTQVDVLEALAFFHNGKTGACFPSTEAIARISRVNDRTVRLTLKVLHDLGFISSVQMPGQKRYFTLHLDRLPTSEALQEPAPLQEITGGEEPAPMQEITGGEEPAPMQEITGGEEPAPMQEITGEGCKKLQGTPAKTYRGPLQKLTPEQGINKESNKEEEQGSLPAQAPWETDHLTNDGKKVEKPKATRAKPKTSCPFSPDDSIPPEYLEYAQAKHPSINAQTEFTKFVNFHISKDNKFSNWLAAWRTWTTKAEEFAKSRPQSQSYTPRNNKPLIFDEAYYGDGSF